MSRTVHHVTEKHRDSYKAEDRRPLSFRWDLFSLREEHTIRALRYSAAIEAAAEDNGHRPRPERVTRRLAAHTYPRSFGIGHVVSGVHERQERALRAADRAAGNRVRQLLRGSQNVSEAARDLDYPDPRHRNFGVWDSY